MSHWEGGGPVFGGLNYGLCLGAPPRCFIYVGYTRSRHVILRIWKDFVQMTLCIVFSLSLLWGQEIHQHRAHNKLSRVYEGRKYRNLPVLKKKLS